MTHFHHFVPRHRRRHRTCCIRRPTLCCSAKRIAVCPTVSTKLPRHTVPKVVGTSAHCVICILKRGRYFVLAQEPLRQISVSSPLNVLNAESSSTLVSLSCKKHGNVAILLKNGNSHGFSQGKELDQRNAALPLHRLHYSENENGWHISLHPAVKVAALVHRWTHLKQDMYQQQTTLTRRIGHALLNDVCEDVWHERIFRKAPPAWSFPGAPLRLLVDSNTFPGRQCHGIAFEQRATHSSVFDEVFRALVWHVCFTKNTSKLPRVSRFHFVQELQQVRHFWIAVGTHSRYSKESVLRLTTLETGYPQLATRLCKRILPASTQRTSNCSKWHTAGEIQISQEESHGKHSTTSPIPSLVVVKNLRRLWLMWCEGKYKTSQHKNTFVNDWRVHSYGSTVWTASGAQRSEAALSQVTEWQAVGFCCTSTPNSMPSHTRHPSSKLTRLCFGPSQTLLRPSMWAHQHMRTTSLERFQGRLQRMSSQESIAPTKLSNLLWHQIMFKTAANKRSFLTSLVAGHTQSFESFLVIVTVWRVVFTAVFDTWDLTLLLTDVGGAKTSRRVQVARNTLREYLLHVIFLKKSTFL